MTFEEAMHEAERVVEKRPVTIREIAQHFTFHRFANGRLVVSCCNRPVQSRAIKGFGVDIFYCKHCHKEARKWTSPKHSPLLTDEFLKALRNHFWVIIK